MNRVTRLAGVLALFTLWTFVTALSLVNPALLPGPIAVARELARLLGGELYADFAATLARVLSGLTIAVFLGIPAGLLVGCRPRLGRALELPIDFYRSLPAVALIPLFVVLLGIGETAKITIAVGAVLPIVLLSTLYGVRAISETRWLLVRSLGMTRWQALRLVIFPAALPHVFAGLRIAVSMATTAAIATEMLIGSSRGLGRRIYDAQLLFRIPELYATVLVAGLVGYGLNKLVLLVERRALHWVGR